MKQIPSEEHKYLKHIMHLEDRVYKELIKDKARENTLLKLLQSFSSLVSGIPSNP
jgi:hypothetical protein